MCLRDCLCGFMRGSTAFVFPHKYTHARVHALAFLIQASVRPTDPLAVKDVRALTHRYVDLSLLRLPPAAAAAAAAAAIAARMRSGTPSSNGHTSGAAGTTSSCSIGGKFKYRHMRPQRTMVTYNAMGEKVLVPFVDPHKVR